MTTIFPRSPKFAPATPAKPVNVGLEKEEALALYDFLLDLQAQMTLGDALGSAVMACCCQIYPHSRGPEAA